MKDIMRGAGAVTKSPIGFARGLMFVLRGMRFVYFQHLSLVRYWLIPILITGVALFGVFYGAGHYYDQLANVVWSLFPDSWNETTGWVGGLLTTLHWLIELIAAVLITVLGLITVVVLSGIVAAPFNDALSEAVERILTGGSAPPFSLRRMFVDVGRAIRIELLKVLIYAAIVGPMFVASFFVPGVGQVASLVGFALTAVYLGIDYVDWPAARRDWSVGDRIALGRRQLPAIAGFGTGVWALLFIPVVNLFFMPAAVAGGTMLFLSLLSSERGGKTPQDRG
ncbi:MAG: EI24 domain-containing protein [Polyangiales bacterium]